MFLSPWNFSVSFERPCTEHKNSYFLLSTCVFSLKHKIYAYSRVKTDAYNSLPPWQGVPTRVKISVAMNLPIVLEDPVTFLLLQVLRPFEMHLSLLFYVLFWGLQIWSCSLKNPPLFQSTLYSYYHLAQRYFTIGEIVLASVKLSHKNQDFSYFRKDQTPMLLCSFCSTLLHTHFILQILPPGGALLIISFFAYIT